MAVATRTRSKAVSGRYAAFERLLRARRSELRNHLRSHWEEVQAQTLPDDTYGRAAQFQLEDLAVGTIEREQALLNEIEQALGRLREGIYGTCTECGDEIPERRLKALPWTRLCLRCAQRRQSVLTN
ncbi:MAG TPA: TraR/DksA family transcriptional regulator [Candidatus Xenobia bacterium]|nr:TraR/DksA family transcriptional regulator [Candidatus Xenobia bacterium]